MRQTHTPTLCLPTNTSTAVCTHRCMHCSCCQVPALKSALCPVWGSSASVPAQRPTSVGFLGFPSTAGLGQSPWGSGGGRAAPQTEGQLGFVLREGPLDLPLTSPGWRLAGAVSPLGPRPLQGRAAAGNPSAPSTPPGSPPCCLFAPCTQHVNDMLLQRMERKRARAATWSSPGGWPEVLQA